MVRVICTVLFPSKWNCEVTEVLSINLCKTVWSTVVSVCNFIVTSMLLRNEYGIMEFQLQQWLCEHGTILCYTYIVCLVLMFIDCTYEPYSFTVYNSLLLFTLFRCYKRKRTKFHNMHYLQWIVIIIKFTLRFPDWGI